eukprot:548183-Hanusia_phi.AAC.1
MTPDDAQAAPGRRHAPVRVGRDSESARYRTVVPYGTRRRARRPAAAGRRPTRSSGNRRQ